MNGLLDIHPSYGDHGSKRGPCCDLFFLSFVPNPIGILTCALVSSHHWSNAFAAELRLLAAIDVGIPRMPLHVDRGYSVCSPVDYLL